MFWCENFPLWFCSMVWPESCLRTRPRANSRGPPEGMGKIVLASNFSFLVWLSGLARVLAELTPRFAQRSWRETAVTAGEQMAAVGDYSDGCGFRKCSVCCVEHDIHEGQAVFAVADSPRSAHPSSSATESQQLWRYATPHELASWSDSLRSSERFVCSCLSSCAGRS